MQTAYGRHSTTRERSTRACAPGPRDATHGAHELTSHVTSEPWVDTHTNVNATRLQRSPVYYHLRICQTIHVRTPTRFSSATGVRRESGPYKSYSCIL